MVWVWIPAGQIPTKALFQGEDIALNIDDLQPNPWADCSDRRRSDRLARSGPRAH